MVKLLVYPMASASSRNIRTHMAWKVQTHMPRVPSGKMAARRSRISAAALLVKVMARICQGRTPSSAIMWAMRMVRTRVFPEPAPARTSRGPRVVSTASRWAGLSPSRSMLARGAGAAPHMGVGSAVVAAGATATAPSPASGGR